MIFDNDSLGLYSIDIKYEGSTSATQYCIDDFMRRLYGSRKIVDMTILTCENYHALMLCFEDQDLVVFIKSGLTSGYPGEGPKGTSLIIRLAEDAKIIIKELAVTPSLFKRINSSLITVKDVEFIKKNSRESLSYDRLCLKIVDKEFVQRAKDSFKKNKDIIFVRTEDEKTKDTVEIDRAKALKMLQEIHAAVVESKKTNLLTKMVMGAKIISIIKDLYDLTDCIQQ